MARPKTEKASETPTGTSASCLRARRRRSSPARLFSSELLLLASLLVGCDKSLAGNLAPDFSGVWDVTYDDAIDVRVRLGDQILRESVGEHGGQLAFHDAGVVGELELRVDCTRDELVCPSEVWPRELDLRLAPGRLDHDGMQLSQSLEGRGHGSCIAQPGSVITGEVMNVASARAVRSEAVALTSGHIRLVLRADCFDVGLPADAVVVLGTGYTAAKR